MSIKALELHLEPLMPFLSMDKVTEVCINQAQEVYVEQESQFTRYPVEALSYPFLEGLVQLIAEYNDKPFPAPFISGILPSGERAQFVMHPACEKGLIVGSIRRHQMRHMTLDDYVAGGAFDDIALNGSYDQATEDELSKLYQRRDMFCFIKAAIAAKKNIVISGGTGTGKTTFLNACLQQIPDDERLITVEDTREVVTTQPNTIHLLFNEHDDRITALKLFQVCLRLRPDRIFLSELRGIEAWPFLRAANSGHPGSLSTVHADTPGACFDQLVFMMQQAGSTSGEERIRRYIQSIVHVVIQLKRCPSQDRFMRVSEVYYRPGRE